MARDTVSSPLERQEENPLRPLKGHKTVRGSVFLLQTAKKMACPALSSSVKGEGWRALALPSLGAAAPVHSELRARQDRQMWGTRHLPTYPHPGAALRGGSPMCKGPTCMHLLGDALPSAPGPAGSSPWVAAWFPRLSQDHRQTRDGCAVRSDGKTRPLVQ